MRYHRLSSTGQYTDGVCVRARVTVQSFVRRHLKINNQFGIVSRRNANLSIAEKRCTFEFVCGLAKIRGLGEITSASR